MYKIKTVQCAEKTVQPSNADAEDKLEKNASLLIRGTIIATGLVGAVVLARSLRLFSKFEHARQIPEEFFRKHIQLRGKVAYMTADGRLRVSHSPIFRSPFAWIRRRKEPDAAPDDEGGKLSLTVAGVDITEQGKTWLRQQLLWRPVWFTLIRRLNEDDIQVEVLTKKGRFSRKYSINRELIRRGLACVPTLDDYTHDFALKTNAEYSRLINELIISEKYADRRGVGMWRRRTVLEALLSYPSQIKDRVEHTSIYRLLALIASGVKQLGKIGYSTGRSAKRMLGDAASDWRKLSKSS